MSAPTLRPYQTDGANAIENALREYQSVLYVLATGAGKTAVAEAVTDRELARGGAVTFLADRQELVRQAHDRIGGAVIMGGYKPTEGVCRPNRPGVTIASVATLARRSEAPDATLAFVDEAHLYAAASFRRVVSAYRDSGTRIVGLTATPARLDGQGLGGLFDVVVQGPPTADLISQEWLVPVRTFAPTGPWWDAVRIKGGDFDAEALQAAAGYVLRDAVAWWRRLGGHLRPTIVFAATQKHAREQAEAFSSIDAGPFEAVTADTPADRRRSVSARIRSGELRGVTTVGVLGTGFDLPELSCEVMLRPTLSWSLYLQQGGRGMRPCAATGKRDLLLLDAAGNSLRHGALTKPFEVSLEGVKRAHRRAVAGLTTCRRCFRVYESTEAVCPECGAARPVTPPRTVKTVDGELREMTGAEQWAERASSSAQVKKLAGWIRETREKNWKPGAPAARFRGLFHRWPTAAELDQARKLAGEVAA